MCFVEAFTEEHAAATEPTTATTLMRAATIATGATGTKAA
jgi:hypothetical protein